MDWYLVTWHETDGNDCTVFDTIVQAENTEAAQNMVADAIEDMLTKNGQPFEGDGDWGVCFNCTEDCGATVEDRELECQGHGGTSLRDVEAFATEADARGALATYHTEWVIS